MRIAGPELDGHRRALLQISYEVDPPCLIVRLDGELDLMTSAALRGFADLGRTDLSTLLLDLGEVTFCDGAGLLALLRFRNAQLQGGRFFFATRVHPQLRSVMEICGVSNRFVA